MKIKELFEGEVIHAKFNRDDRQAEVKGFFNSLKKPASAMGFDLKTETFKFEQGWIPSIVFEKTDGDRRMVINATFDGVLNKFYVGCLLYVNDKLVFNSTRSGSDSTESAPIGGGKLIDRFEETLKMFSAPLTAKQKSRLKRGGLK